MEKGCLGNAIRSARLKANITQEDLSEKLGISVTHLKHIESEHRLPSVPLLIKVMTALGMSFDLTPKKIQDFFTIPSTF